MDAAPEPAVEAIPPLPPPAYREVIEAPHAYPPQHIPDLENRQDELPTYDQEPANYEDSLVLLFFSGIPPFAYELLLMNGVKGPFKLTGARILNLVAWAVGITTAVLGLRDQAISSSTLAVTLVVLCTGLYVLEKYKEDRPQFAPWLFEKDYKSNVVHGGIWAVQLLLSWYPPFMTMLHAAEVYLKTHGTKRDPKDGVVIGLICISIFLSYLGIAYLFRRVMVGLQFPPRLRQLGRRNHFYLLIVEEAIIVIPRVLVSGGVYGILKLAAPSFRISSEAWALESQRAAQHTAQFVAYAFVAFVGFRILHKFF